MHSLNRDSIGKAERLRLILDVRKAYDGLAALVHQRDNSPHMLAALIRTMRKVLEGNRALAVLALESASRPKTW